MSISIIIQENFPVDENDRGEAATASGIYLHVLIMIGEQRCSRIRRFGLPVGQGATGCILGIIAT
jgi:hypothetical protein